MYLEAERTPAEGVAGRPAPAGPIEVQGLTFDPQRRVVTHRGRSAELTGREADLFAFLLANPDRYFTANELVTDAWGASHLSAEELRVYVRRLRQKLAPLTLPFELTSQKWLGYCLARSAEKAEVEASSPAGSQAEGPANLRLPVPLAGRRTANPRPIRWGGVAGMVGVSLLVLDTLLHLFADHRPGAPPSIGTLAVDPWHLPGLVGLLLMALGWVAMCYMTWSTRAVTPGTAPPPSPESGQ